MLECAGVCSLSALIGLEVSVGIQCHLEAGMADQFLEALGRHATLNLQAGLDSSSLIGVIHTCSGVVDLGQGLCLNGQ